MTRRVLAEALGTSLLLYVVVGSGIAAEVLSVDPGVQLLTHAIAAGVGLSALITMLQTVSGSHFNPSVTLALWRARSISGIDATSYVVAQIIGAVAGVVAANLSFGQDVVSVSAVVRSGAGLIFAESVVTFVLVLIILALVRTNRPATVPVAVGAWVATAIVATSSRGFANPAATVARIFTDTYTGIAPASVPVFILAQLIAAMAAAKAAVIFYPESFRQQAPI